MASRSKAPAVAPPIEPMLARVAEEIPPQGGFLYELKWDGFRAIVFRGKDDVFIQSRDLRPFDRYFPDLHALFLERLLAKAKAPLHLTPATLERKVALQWLSRNPMS